jgi:hypothetical protein
LSGFSPGIHAKTEILSGFQSGLEPKISKSGQDLHQASSLIITGPDPGRVRGCKKNIKLFASINQLRDQSATLPVGTFTKEMGARSHLSIPYHLERLERHRVRVI